MTSKPARSAPDPQAPQLDMGPAKPGAGPAEPDEGLAEPGAGPAEPDEGLAEPGAGPAADEGQSGASEPGVHDGDVTSAAFGYLGAIFLGPVIPLIVYAIKARRSPFLRYHAAVAVNLSLTCTLYVVCCAILGGLLALDSVTVALVIAVPLLFGLWLIMLRYLLRGVVAANHGEEYEIPSWICARIVT
jgi:uncharacterized Tic20 family protein